MSVAKDDDSHPMMEGPIDHRFEGFPITHDRFSSFGFPVRDNLSLRFSPSVPRIRPLALPEKLADKERGAVLQFGIRWIGGEPKLSGSDGEAAWRAAVLLSDKLDWPIASNVVMSSADPGGLVSAGVMSRAPMAIEGRISEDQLNHMPFTLFDALNTREPGRWSIWAGSSENPVPDTASEPDLAFRLKLNRALLIPDTDVPYTDLVEFKGRHAKKVIKLRHHLERLALQVARNGWQANETNLEIEALDEALAAYLEEARKPNWKKAVANLEFSTNWIGVGKGAAIAGIAAAAGMPLVGALLGLGEAAASTIEIKSVRGIKSRVAESPFEYLAEIDRKFGD